ncbi:protein in late step of protoheme IX synthesis with TPR-like domain [Xenorhabdus nematophila ATCC 19061]|uniref:Protein in late step of protoheme IX synthesis with TPR-like domain n=1 Tax=Xenorhabdus nematophila (strain ATCC 19061 / DSM 3370 / CCUG 14189 / LMG 1036 / NCIMB 9965 / AN6) TaxID=406817 RepID=D3VHZ0_XENNA|nr:protoheme IX biogenesis protein HemY [Xenorhabdus nematophila]CBJ88479.1 protein in late step of protoheme IX synthesis with TPR-like domain [Xenorhabdus nematophila ATCC 19061]CEK21394.1 protein in late step of protoheme IX synthesis with TPR-like domain [Xenorhabdus nematophila AN6/1]
MLKILLLFIILIVGIILGPVMSGHQGYVLIQTDSNNITTSITAVVIMFLLLQFLLIFIGWCYRRLKRTSTSTHSWIFGGFKRNRARSQTRQALLKLAEGDFKQVEHLMTRNADHAEYPVVNYLLAAEAAQQRGDYFHTNQYIERAAEVADKDQLPVDISRVRIQLAQGEIHAARNGVDKLLNHAPRHPEVLRLAERAYSLSGAYQALIDVLPSMIKAKLYDEEKIHAIRQQAYVGLMNQVFAEKGCTGLKAWWKDQGRKIRQDIVLQVVMAEHLIACNDHDTAQQIILDGLKQQYDERLLLLIPHLKANDAEAIQKNLTHLLKQHGATPLLNSTMGQVALRHGEWANAEAAFKAALAQRPDAHDYAWLADALDKLQKHEEATQTRSKGFMLTLKRDSNTGA